jgi:hypothetical protein
MKRIWLLLLLAVFYAISGPVNAQQPRPSIELNVETNSCERLNVEAVYNYRVPKPGGGTEPKTLSINVIYMTVTRPDRTSHAYSYPEQYPGSLQLKASVSDCKPGVRSATTDWIHNPRRQERFRIFDQNGALRIQRL